MPMPEEKAPELPLPKPHTTWTITATNRKGLLHKCLNHFLFRPFKSFLIIPQNSGFCYESKAKRTACIHVWRQHKSSHKAPDPFCLPKDHRLDQESLTSTCSRLLMLLLGLHCFIWHGWTSPCHSYSGSNKVWKRQVLSCTGPCKDGTTQLLPPLLDGTFQLPKTNVNI